MCIELKFSASKLKAHANGRNTELGVVGTCCVGACKRTQQLPTLLASSKEAMHSGTVILAMRVRKHFHAANIVVVPGCKRGNIVALRITGNRTVEMLGLVAPKV